MILLKKLFRALSPVHIHEWRTTHTNKWMHDLRQVCDCRTVKEFKYKENADEIIGMPWNKGEWVLSDGTKEKYYLAD